jgi:OOP family OmpA-OmpF porin
MPIWYGKYVSGMLTFFEQDYQMKKSILLLGLASCVLTGPALSRDKSGYIGIEGGGMILKDIDYGVVGVPGASLPIDSKKGLDVDLVTGYDFGMFRLEAEGGYKRAKVDTADTAALNGFAVSGRTDAWTGMVNGLLDLGSDDGLGFSFGGGAGLASVKGRYTGPGVAISDRDSGFAWQVIAALRVPVTSKVDLGAKYRFFTVDSVKLTEGGATVDGRWRSHSLLASLIYNFGQPAAPPPPPPPPPPPAEAPPPPPPPPAAVPGPFIVFFDFDKSNITLEAASILDNAAQGFTTTGQAQVMLAGHADKAGGDDYNVALSQRRADAAKAYLAGKGVPEAAIVTEAFGESRPLVETADGVREPQNRRVEITFGPGSGQ